MSDRDIDPSSANGTEWYKDGLRFSCTQCGNCCTGPPGVVWFNDDEADAMAKKLGISRASFFRKYTRKVGQRHSLKERVTEHGHDCVFLDRESQPGRAVCSLYEARPTQCRTWPFWPENLHSPMTWRAVKRATPCPGMDHGKLVPVEEIRIQRDSHLDE